MLDIMLSKDSLKNSYFQRQQDVITKYMADIELANSKINEICEKTDIDLEHSGSLESKILKSQFITQVFKKLSEIESIVSTPPSFLTSVPLQNSTTEQQQYTHMPKIQYTKFSGDGFWQIRI